MIMGSSPVPSSPRLLPFLFFRVLRSPRRAGARRGPGDAAARVPRACGGDNQTTKVPPRSYFITGTRRPWRRRRQAGRQAGWRAVGSFDLAVGPWRSRPSTTMGSAGREMVMYGGVRSSAAMTCHTVLTSVPRSYFITPGTRRPCSYRCSTSRSRSSSPPPPRACRVSPCTHAGTGQRPASFPALMKLPQTVRRP